MMKKYSLMFQHRDGETEFMWCDSELDAWKRFSMFAEARSSDIYAYITIRSNDRTLAVLTFLEDVA